MKITQLEEIKWNEPFVLAIGFFDGCHKGHQKVLEEAKKIAEQKNAKVGVLTFFPHPLSILFPDKIIPLLQSEEEKEEALKNLGIHEIIFLKPTKEFLSVSKEQFLEKLGEEKNLLGIVGGSNFTFGKNAKGTMKDMEIFFAGKNVTVKTIFLETEKENIISSTKIREFILQGEMEEAKELLGRYYTVYGDVVHGFQRGQDVLGFPTANLALPNYRVVPARGVYVTRTRIDGKVYWSVTNIGVNPTFGNTEQTIETFILNFDESIYGKKFTLEWIKRLRGEIKFPSPKELIKQINQDIEDAKEVLARVEYEEAKNLSKENK